MFKVSVFKEVAIAGWMYDRDTHTKCADGYLRFYYELTVPFAPYIGLRYSNSDWLPEPISSVRYDLDKEEFICSVVEDNEIPDQLEKLIMSGDKSEEQIEKYLAEEIKFKRSLYRSRGWKEYRPRNSDESA